ncbi:6494_t:CDS:2 [Cetraspora pellucida]|uniref:6494_t:CDS:1 n=1 Tax=Cetraspora pellucida TaxID=1433469 RepID=A0A9N9EI72_9GLOM|nr:6494_t:CDS:2 [Cetraspora pellucida]
MANNCQLCNEIFSSRKKLVIHERIRHRNNKIIPHRYLLTQPPLEQIIFYQDAFIVLIKKRLGFNRHSIGTKQVSINAFPENIFVYLFENEPSFRYSPVQQKYSCSFQGEAGEQRLKQLVNYDYWNVRQDPKLKTKGYVLFIDNDSSYEVTFSWSQSELKENDPVAQTNAPNPPQLHEVDLNKNSNNIRSFQRHYRFILPRVPFQQINH